MYDDLSDEEIKHLIKKELRTPSVRGYTFKEVEDPFEIWYSRSKDVWELVRRSNNWKSIVAQQSDAILVHTCQTEDRQEARELYLSCQKVFKEL